MNSVIELDDVVALYGSHPALAGATVRVERGEIVLVRGPNGAGKSSLLRLCAGLVAPSRGSAHVLGHDLAVDRESVGKRVGLLGQRNGLFLDLTAEENVSFWGGLSGADDDEMDQAMQRMGITATLRKRRVGAMSTGQRKRVALACLVTRRAELWLLDEPHSGLDAAGRDELDAVLRAASTAGATIVLASHEAERAERLGARVVSMSGGRVTS
jgi:heme ABC exporter ATP-binding subunit CcmA